MVAVQWPPEFGQRVALWDAVYAQDAAAVQKLLATPRGVQQVNVANGIWQRTSVHVAVATGHRKILKMLLFTPGVNVNARTIDGSTPLHLAIEKARKDMIQDLVLVGANPLLLNRTGKTAIAMARTRGLADMSSLLQQTRASQSLQEALKTQSKNASV